MTPIVKPPACCTCPIFGRLCDPLNPNIPGPVPGFFGFGMCVSAYILSPVSPGLGVGGGIWGQIWGHRLRPVWRGFAAPGGPMPGRHAGPIVGTFGGPMGRAVWRVNWCPGGPIGPVLRPIRAHAARLPNVPGAWFDGMPGRMDRRGRFHAKHAKPRASH